VNAGELFLGLDVGGTKCAAVLGSAGGEILDRIEWPSDAHRGPVPMIDDLCRHAVSLASRHSQSAAIGVSIGGPLDAINGIIHSPPNLPGWDNIELKSILENRLSLPVRIEHDAAACCLAEYTWGAGRGATRLIYLTCGTGFGAGIVIDGKIYRGAGGRSVEIGHARYRDDGPTAFGKSGSVEAWCSGGALPALAAYLFPQRWATSLPTVPQLIELRDAGDPRAMQTIAANARATGDVCALLGDFLRPDRILLGSLARHLGPSWVQLVQARFAAEVLPDSAAACIVEPAGLGPRLQDCSALVVAVAAVNIPH
jgi:glucokinase